VGEAIAYAYGGVPVTEDRILLTNFSGLSDEFSLLSPTPDPSDPKSVAAAAAAAAGKPASGPGEAETRTWVADKLLRELVVHTRAEVRCAATVWLVSLLTYCASAAELQALLGAVQEAMGHLLGDVNELTQEMASRGISLVYGRGDEETRKKLVEGLVGVLQGGAKAKAVVKLSADTKVFEDGALGNAPPQVSAK
jgi:proteasome component ECM29